MAGMTAVVDERAQFAAIALLRWRLFVNSLRSKGGQLEFGSRIVAASIYALGGLSAAVGLGFSAYHFVMQGKSGLLAVLLWPVFLSWQLLPVMISSFSDNIELSGLLRFPLTYRSYVLVRLLYGLMDIGTILGTFCLGGILTGIASARLSLLLPGLLILLTFALVNVLLSRTLFAWTERWLAQRRTRELMGGLFIVLLLGIQLINPAMQHYHGRTESRARQLAVQLGPYQRILPPGIAAAAIEKVAASHHAGALGFTAYLFLYAAGISVLLSSRLSAQYKGENLSEAGVPAVRNDGRSKRFTSPVARSKLRPVSGAFTADRPARGQQLSAPIMAILEKEFRYFMRSGPMLITLLTPVFMLVVLGSQWRGGNAYRFPAGMAYATLVLANLIYNCFGTDAGGVQIYLTAPVRMRTVVLAKNLTSVGILLVEMVLIFAAVSLIYGLPSLQVVIVTVAWILFSMPINLSCGNLLSLQAPKKMNFERFGRQQSSALSVLSSLGVQVVTIGSGALVIFSMRNYADMWPAAALFMALAVATFSIYLVLLNGIDRVALNRRENLIAELCKS